MPIAVPATFAEGSPSSVQPLSQVGHTDVVTTSPRVPTPAGQPCVVNLFQDLEIMESDFDAPEIGTSYSYAPPAGCQGPWAKVVLKIDLAESADGDPSVGAYLRLGGIQIFESSFSNLRSTSDGYFVPSWHAERDVTDIASILTQAQPGEVGLSPEQNLWYNMANAQATVSAKLLFYPATAAAPAQQTPDAVYPISPVADTVTLPHNIVRAYLDVYNQEPWWFTCVPDQELYAGSPFWSTLAMGGAFKTGIGPPGQGCGGGSFAEIGVSIDGTPAGVAPVFPLVSANLNYFFANTVSAPIQTPGLTDHLPYRVDLTPFAAILNEAGDHTIALSRPTKAYLLVYQDKDSTLVTGAVTLNTLAGSNGTPAVTDTIATSGDTASGTVSTGLDRDFRIKGFVNTSHGRVNSSVRQTSHFQNTQTFYLEGLDGTVIPESRHYGQYVSLASRTRQHSRRVSAGVVLNDDLRTASYPLDLHFDMDGNTVDYGDGVETIPSNGSASIEQHRNINATYRQAGVVLYRSHVRESFTGSRTHDVTTDEDSDWQSQDDYRFHDSQGSCFHRTLTALDGAVTADAKGVDCRGGHNHVRWYAHPDGSPDSLGWMH
jgi:hypothetical protein